MDSCPCHDSRIAAQYRASMRMFGPWMPCTAEERTPTEKHCLSQRCVQLGFLPAVAAHRIEHLQSKPTDFTMCLKNWIYVESGILDRGPAPLLSFHCGSRGHLWWKALDKSAGPSYCCHINRLASHRAFKVCRECCTQPSQLLTPCFVRHMAHTTGKLGVLNRSNDSCIRSSSSDQ